MGEKLALKSLFPETGDFKPNFSTRHTADSELSLKASHFVGAVEVFFSIPIFSPELIDFSSIIDTE